MSNYFEKNSQFIEKTKNIIDEIFPERSPLVYIETYGCQQNEADSEKLLGMACDLGYVKTTMKDEADLILVNTCAVREHAELKALSNTGQLKHIKAKNPRLVIGVCGCMVQQDHRTGDIKHKYPYVDFVFGTNKTFDFPELLYSVLTEKKRHFFVESYDTNSGEFCEGVPTQRAHSNKAWVSIMYGCNNFCTYCVVPYVRGRERSRTPDAILAEINSLIEQGYRDITLLGQNVNSYGKDLPVQMSFVELLEMIEQIPTDFVLRFMTSHPKDATHELFDFIAKSRKLEHHFHIPLQSGSDRILALMNRRYTFESFKKLCDYAREKIPDITFSTYIIVGFPGETEEDFRATLEAMKTIKFDSVYSFVYSKRVGTKAEKMPDQIDEATKKDRIGRLILLQQDIASDNNNKMNGCEYVVCVEGNSKSNENVLSARTKDGKQILFSKENTPELKTGDMVIVKVTNARSYTIFGEYIKKIEEK